MFDLWDELSFTMKAAFIQWSYIATLSLIAFILLITFNYRCWKRSFQLSAQLRIHLYTWTTFMFVTFIYAGPIVYGWKSSAPTYNWLGISIRGSINSGFLIISPISTFFLTIDRIICLKFPMLKRQYIQILSVLSLFIGFLMAGGLFFWRSYLKLEDGEIKEMTTCFSVACQAQDKFMETATVKMTLAWCNICSGALFLYIYQRYGKNFTIRRERKKNYLILWILCSELMFNITPTTIYMIVLHTNVQNYFTGVFGTVLTLGHVTDGLIQSLVFWHIWRYRSNSVQTLNRQVKVITRTQPVAGSTNTTTGHC